jgi:hypothetical protein
MASTDLYKIHVLKFHVYNSTLKKGHKATLISNNFCSDSKLGVLPLTVRWMFLGIVLTCGDYTSDTIEMNERQLRELLESSWSVPRALDSLQSIQVLSYSKIDLFINRIEKKVIEENRKEKNPRKPKTEAKNLPENPTDLSVNKANEFISLYCQAFKARHHANAEIDGKSAGIAKRITKTLSREKWIPYLQAFFTMPDAYLFKNRHPLAQFEYKLQEIAVFAQSGNFTTQKQASQIDNQSTIESQIKRIQEGQV